MKNFYWIILFNLFSTNAIAKSFYAKTEVQQFIKSMVKQHHFEKQQLKLLFNKYESSQEVLQKITQPTENLSWGQYQKLLISVDRISKGKIFITKYQNALLKAEDQFGVPKEFIAAILGIESYYGEIVGKFPVIQSLATLAFDYPARSKFFKKELEQFLLLTREEKLDPAKVIGSYAGAMSPAQFISSSYRAYAIDFAEVGTKDLNNMQNAIGSIANYFYRHGWEKNGRVVEKIAHKKNDNNILEFIINEDLTEYWVGFKNFYVIKKYNNSNNYAMAVYQLSKELGLKEQKVI